MSEKEEKHGEWIEHESECECSLCGALTCYFHKYCPNCGARMDGGKEQ